MTRPSGDDEAQRHVVIFDCNVYLDVASLLGSPFTWEAFSATAARMANGPLPHPEGAVDSLRALAVCMSGRFAGREPLEVWTSAHIDVIVREKASHPDQPHAGRRGLGWAFADAQGLVDDLIHGLVESSDGGTLGEHVPDGNPPLDHEDGMVYGACRLLAGEDPLSRVYCVTRDRDFVAAGASGALLAHTRVLPPAQFVQLVRAARHSLSIRRIARS